MVSESEIAPTEDPIIELVKQEYLPEIVQISDELERGSSPTFNKTASRVYLRKGGISYLVPKGLEWFAINYYNLRTKVRRLPLKIFLSYPREDLWIAYKIQKILTEIGVYVYIAELFPEPGMTLWEKIKAMIENSDLVIVLWTKNALSSAFVNQELGFAEARQRLIVPIVEKGAATHGLLNGREHIAFERGRDIETYSTLCQSLYNFLSKKIEQQATNVLGLGLGILFLVALFAALGSKK